MAVIVKSPHVEVGEKPGSVQRNTHNLSGSNTTGSWETVPGIPIQTLDKKMSNSIIVAQGYITGRCNTRTIQIRLLIDGVEVGYVASSSKTDAYLGVNGVSKTDKKGPITIELQWRGQDNTTTANIPDFSPRSLIAYEVAGGGVIDKLLSKFKRWLTWQTK